MAVVIDPGAGALAQGISNLGQGIVQYIFRERIRENQIRRDPNMVASLGPAARAAIESGSTEQAARAFGVSEGFLSDIAQATPISVAEQEEIAGREAGLGGRRVAGEVAELGAGEAEAAVRQSFAQRFFELGGPEMQAMAQRAGAELNLRDAEINLGLITLKGDTQEALLNQQLASAEIGESAARTYGEILSRLEPGSFEETFFVSSLIAPTAASGIVSMRNADLSAGVQAAAAGAQSEEDKIALTVELMTRFDEAVDRAAKIESGELEGDVEQARQSVNNARLLIQTLQNKGALSEGITLVAAEGRRNRIDFVPVENLSDRASAIITEAENQLTRQGPTEEGGALGDVETVRAQLEAALEDDRLTARDKEQIQAEFARLVEAIEEQSRGRRGLFSGIDPNAPSLQEQIAKSRDFLGTTVGAGLTGTPIPR